MTTTKSLKDIVIHALEDLKALDITILDVRHLTSITDIMIICTGRSIRHMQSIADNVVLAAKQHGYRPLSTEGNPNSGWVLVDLGDIVVHVMTDEVRKFYELEKLWNIEQTEAIKQ